MSHTIITLAAVLAASIIGYEWCAVVACFSFWAGREHAQAEYRYMDKHKTNRSGSPWCMGLFFESWNCKSLVIDLMLPTLIGLAVCVWLT